jgi:FkbM family methyltransferase
MSLLLSLRQLTIGAVRFGLGALDLELRRIPARGLKAFCRHTKTPIRSLRRLSGDSWFVDIGAFEGECAQAIYDEFQCNVVCFEPSARAVYHLLGRFYGKTKVSVIAAGVSDRTEKVHLLHKANADGHSLFEELAGDASLGFEEVQTIDLVEYLDRAGIKKVDLMKINCEGCEWKLLTRLIDSGRISSVVQLVIQWHGSVCAPTVWNETWARLSRTHDRFRHHRAWELWTLKGALPRPTGSV